MYRAIGAAAFFYLFYVVSAGTGWIGSILIFRHRMTLNRWDYILMLLSGLIWAGLILVDGNGKSLSNAVVEPVLLGVIASLLFVLRCAAPKRHQSTSALTGTIAASIAAVFIWWLVPGLPE